ncbi:MAG TPA: hypothetical protein VMF60_06590, partial [Acidimicrobiales bacterium]|nr:hypothetical protein [Acidimicrobiales bacterium]
PVAILVVVFYVATVHWRSPKWIDIQLAYLRRNMGEPFKTFAVLNGIDPAFHDRFDTLIPANGTHAGKLNLMAAEIADIARPDDVIVFLDGDAFPIADPVPAISRALSEGSLLAVRRDENAGDCQPHPSFCAIRVSEWLRLAGDWSPGYVWTNSDGRRVTDVGANLLASLVRSRTTWTPLLRSNLWNPHPLWFGVYGDLVYHHGAGFRPGRGTRAEGSLAPAFDRGEELPGAGRALRTAKLLRSRRAAGRLYRQAEALNDAWFDRIEADPDFFSALLRAPAAPGGPGRLPVVTPDDRSPGEDRQPRAAR